MMMKPTSLYGLVRIAAKDRSTDPSASLLVGSMSSTKSSSSSSGSADRLSAPTPFEEEYELPPTPPPSRMSSPVSSLRAPASTTGETKRERVSLGTYVLRAGARGKAGRARSGSSSLPPSIQITPTVDVTYRYQTLATGIYPITVGSVLGALGGICTVVNSKFNTWSGSFKVRKVTVWPPSTSSSPTTGCFWRSGASGQVPDQELDGTIPAGVTVTKSLVFKPPRMSLCGFWIDSADLSSTIFDLEITEGSIVDFAVTYRLSNVFASSQLNIASGVVGTVYYLALDGASSNKISPTLLPSTA